MQESNGFLRQDAMLTSSISLTNQSKFRIHWTHLGRAGGLDRGERIRVLTTISAIAGDVLMAVTMPHGTGYWEATRNQRCILGIRDGPASVGVAGCGLRQHRYF